MVGIAEMAVEITPCKTDEYRGITSMMSFSLKGVEYFVDFSHFSVSFINGGITLAFDYLASEAIFNVVHYPLCYVFSCRIEGENVVEHLVVEIAENKLFYMGEVGDHSVFVELRGSALDVEYPVVAVDVVALTVVS